MNSSPTDRPNYAGPAAAAVFLVGLFIIGNWALKIAISGVVLFIIALATFRTPSRQSLIGCIGLGVCCALIAYKALSYEISGIGIYFNGQGRLSLGTETVTRQQSPAKFRQGANMTWGFSAYFGVFSAAYFVRYRKLRSG